MNKKFITNIFSDVYKKNQYRLNQKLKSKKFLFLPLKSRIERELKRKMMTWWAIKQETDQDFAHNSVTCKLTTNNNSRPSFEKLRLKILKNAA